ncbi:MAG: hypothetical protein ABFR95_01190 [Actinomycetota bacterium]
MWKKSMVIIGGAALAVSIPMAALAATSDVGTLGSFDPIGADDAPYAERYQASDVDAEQTQARTAVRQQLRTHIETGPPEGFEPVQQQLREHDQLGTGNPDARQANTGVAKGNPDAPMLGDGTGDCTQDGEPLGTGPHGPGGRNNG